MGKTCRCPAYKFPHRHGGGACSGSYDICTACSQACHEVKVDFGIGPYEYGSICAIHKDIHMVSDCCEAEVYKISEDPCGAAWAAERQRIWDRSRKAT